MSRKYDGGMHAPAACRPPESRETATMDRLCAMLAVSRLSTRRSGGSAGQVPGQVIDDCPRVVFDAADERRPAPAQDGQPESVQARARDHAALVLQLALRVEYGHVEPAIVRPVAGGPHDRADLPAAQVNLQPR